MTTQPKPRQFVIDTNAGPIVRHNGTVESCKTYMQRMIPLLRRGGHTCKWRRSNEWYVIDVIDGRGRVVHSAAFREEPSDES